MTDTTIATPGPWNALRINGKFWVESGGRMLARVYPPPVPHVSNACPAAALANARLMAHAPAMRDALAQIARMRPDGEVDEHGVLFDLSNDDAVDGLHSCIRLAREALAGV